MGKKLLMLGLCAVVLAAAYFMLGDGTAPEESAPAEADEYYMLLERQEDELKEFSITSGTETLVFVPDADNATGWRLKADGRLLLDEYYMQSLIRGVTELGTEHRLAESTDDPGAYGLEPPQARAEIKYTDGGESVLLVGSMTPDGDYYYIMREGDPAVYMVSANAGEKYSFTLADLIDMNLPVINASELQYAYISEGGREIELSPKAGADELAEYGIVSLQMTKPYAGREVYLSDFTDNVLAALDGLRFDELVEAEAAELTQYGLDAPELYVNVRDNENELTLIVGALAGEGMRYAKRAGDGMVFKIAIEKLTRLRNIDVLSFMERFVALISIDTVDRLQIYANGRSTQILLNAESAASEDGGEAELKYSPTADGKAVEFDRLRTYYTALIGLSCDSAITGYDPADAEAEFRVTYYLTDGETVECAYYAYDDNFYAVSVDGGAAEFAVSRQSVNTVVRMLRELTDEGIMP